MGVVSMKQLLEAGVHFGHQTRRWNPKMAPYIFTERNGIYIIDLQKTVRKLDEAYMFIRDLSAQGESVLFVGTKKQAQEAKAEAIAYVQEIITDFQIKSSDLKFADDPVVVTTVKKTRGKSPIKYRLPNGVEWTGKGNMKREVRAFLEANNMTREDLDQFLTEQFKK